MPRSETPEIGCESNLRRARKVWDQCFSLLALGGSRLFSRRYIAAAL